MAIPRSEVTRQRKAQAKIAKLATDDLAAKFARLPLDKPEAARNMLRALMPQLVTQYGDMAASVAADAYDAWRQAAKVKGKYLARMHDSPYLDATDKTVRRAAGHLWTDNPAATLTALQGPLGKYVLAAGRETIARNADEDPRASGWMRETGGGCEFCEMLADRGGVYSEASANFAAHNNCNCSAVPSWDESARPVSVETYQASERTSGMSAEQKAAHSARTQEWMRKNGYLKGEPRTAPVVKPAPTTRSGKPAKAKDGSAFDRLSRSELQHQLDVLGPPKDSDWKRKQVKRLRDRLAELDS